MEFPIVDLSGEADPKTRIVASAETRGDFAERGWVIRIKASSSHLQSGDSKKVEIEVPISEAADAELIATGLITALAEHCRWL